MKNVMIVLGIVMILVGLTGCGKSEKDYIGNYVCKFPGDHNQKAVLEIRADHTWEYRSKSKVRWSWESHKTWDFTHHGRWKIVEGKIVLHGSGAIIAQETIEAELKGNELIDQHGSNNEVFIKQD